MRTLKHIKTLSASALVLAGLLYAQTGALAYTLMPYRWEAKTVPIYFRFDPGIYNGAFNAAMQKWNTVNPAVQLRNSRFDLPQDAVGIACGEGANSASFAYGVCGRPWEDKVLAITLVREENGIARQGSVIFNSRIPFALYSGPRRPEGIDFGRVALHELGHFLGLDHEQVQAAIMQPKIGDTDSLSADDRLGIAARYPN